MKLSPITGAVLAASLLTSASTALAQSQSAVLSPAWLLIKYGTSTGDDIELIPMPDMDFCEVAGAAWATSKKLYRSSKKGFTCIQGDYADDVTEEVQSTD